MPDRSAASAAGMGLPGEGTKARAVRAASGVSRSGGLHCHCAGRSNLRHVAVGERRQKHTGKEALPPPYGGKRALDSTGQPLFVDRSVLSGIGQSGVPFSQLLRIRADHGDKKLQLCDSDKAHRRGQESGSVSDPSVSGCGRQRRDPAS